MRFRYFDFTKIFAKRERVASSRTGSTGTRTTRTQTQTWMALAALFACLCPLMANAQARRINGYAVQVAALSSRKSADTLTNGLNSRGLNAYWIGSASYNARGATALYRVRIGNFQTIASANSYAEKLVGSGLVGAYAITAYEPPSTGDPLADSSWKIPTFAQKRPQRYQGPQFGIDMIDVVATIGSRGWLLLSSESINLTVGNGNSPLSRELEGLAAMIGSRGWGVNANVAGSLVAPAPITVVPLPNGIIASAPPAASSSSIPGAGSFNAAAPEIGRGGLTPTTSTSLNIGAGTSGPRGYNSPPRLQGSLEMRGGRMLMTLRSAETDRVFSGVARISLSEDQRQEDVAPITINLLPGMETVFQLENATLTNGAWILMVYDQNGAARLIRGATFVPPKSQTPSTAAASAPEPDPASEAPPSYVTGVYDTTTWTQPQVSPQSEATESPVNVVSAQDSAAASIEGGALPNQQPQAANDPGAVAATLRQIASTSENTTLELEISAQNPLKNITVVLRAGDFQDVRQAFIPTSQGRVPFLVPAKFASSGISYEVRDEAQRQLVSGSASLRSLAK